MWAPANRESDATSSRRRRRRRLPVDPLSKSHKERDSEERCSEAVAMASTTSVKKEHRATLEQAQKTMG